MIAVLLFVDDHEPSLEVAKDVIEGVDMVTVSTIDAAHAAFAEQEFALVLLDQDLGPGRYGHEIAGWIRAQGSSVPILALSSSSKASDWKAMEDNGADGFVRKSDLTDVAPLIEHLAKGRQLPVGQKLVKVFNHRIQL